MTVQPLNQQEYVCVYNLSHYQLDIIITHLLKTYKCDNINIYGDIFNEVIQYEAFSLFGYKLADKLVEKISNMLYLFETLHNYETHFSL